MKITAFKILPRTSNDNVEIGPFISKDTALEICKENKYGEHLIVPITIELSDLQKLAYFLIKNHGIEVLCDKQEPRSYFSFSDGKQIGHIYYTNCGYNYSKTNRPSEKHGTGHQTMSEVEATVENCITTLNSYEVEHNNRCSVCGSIIAKSQSIYYENVTQFINYEKKFRKNYGKISLDEIVLFIK